MLTPNHCSVIGTSRSLSAAARPGSGRPGHWLRPLAMPWVPVLRHSASAFLEDIPENGLSRSFVLCSDFCALAGAATIMIRPRFGQRRLSPSAGSAMHSTLETRFESQALRYH